jgi:S1-C subfamily serine protease
MKKSAFVFAMALSSVLWTSAQAAGPFGTIRVGQWGGGAYTDDSTGSFSHCAATASYVSGYSLSLGQNAQKVWLIGFANSNWNLTAGETFPIDITFDGQAQFHIAGSAANSKLITAILPEPAANRLRKSRLMIATGRTQTIPFALNSIEALLPVIAYCVDKTKADGVANAGDFSKLPSKPPSVAAAAKSNAVTNTSPSTVQSPKLISITGTGFVLDASGHIVTNNHVISDCVGDVRGNLVGDNTATLRIVSADEMNDLALLQAPGSFKDTAIIRSTAVHSGDSVIAIGFPFHGLLTSDFTVTTGIVSSLSGLLNDSRFLQISAPVQPGNSGGPLLDTSGHVVGVVAEKINALKIAKATGNIPENISFAIKTGALRDFLDNSVVPYRTSDSTTELKNAEIASAARAYTMLISCMAKDSESERR